MSGLWFILAALAAEPSAGLPAAAPSPDAAAVPSPAASPDGAAAAAASPDAGATAPAASPEGAPTAPAASAEAAPVLPAAADPQPVVGPPLGPPLSGPALDAATQRVASQIRCPVCQGLSVADSPSESAIALKQEVRRIVALGYTDEQCLLYFEASYGEFIRLEPKAEGLNLLVWAGPVALVVIGLAGIAWMRLGNRRKGPAPAVELPPIPVELMPYVERVYQIVGKGE